MNERAKKRFGQIELKNWINEGKVKFRINDQI